VKPPWELAFEEDLTAFLVVPPNAFLGLFDGEALFN
jgi:hypothetical protein